MVDKPRWLKNTVATPEGYRARNGAILLKKRLTSEEIDDWNGTKSKKKTVSKSKTQLSKRKEESKTTEDMVDKEEITINVNNEKPMGKRKPVKVKVKKAEE